MKVWMWPKENSTNKYNELLSTSLEEEGIDVKEFNKSKAFKMKKNDIFHFHWIYPLYQANNRLIFIMKSIALVIYLYINKVRGVKLVWTLHNLYPHKYKFIKLEKLVRKIILLIVDEIFVASTSIKDKVIKEFSLNANKVSVVKHGHYLDAYPTNELKRDKYNISKEDYVFLFLGAIQEYKGTLKLLEEYVKTNIYSNSKLLIVGKPDQIMKEKLKKFQNDKNIILDLRFVPEEEINGIIGISNIVVLPYKQITTSGSAILALSNKKPFIAPKNAFFEEYFNDRTCILYSNDDLKEALEAAFKKEFYADDFDDVLETLNWDKIAKFIIKRYKKIIR
ncbi:glycosyltransferase [Rossellomorea marisflavi]|uniref:glycosyltransferase n=1 Tax=Rossellomorea marisflavi TaxID=189381 RepID=UPI003D2F30C6